MAIFAETRTMIKWFKLSLAYFISLAGIGYLLYLIDFREFLAILPQLDGSLIGTAIFALAIGYGIRIYRWSMLISYSIESSPNTEMGLIPRLPTACRKPPISTLDCIAPLIGATALNNILPLRAGDWLRAFVFPANMNINNSLGKNEGISRAIGTATLIVERWVDLWLLLFLLALALLFTPIAAHPLTLVIAIFLFCLACLLAAMLAYIEKAIPVIARGCCRYNARLKLKQIDQFAAWLASLSSTIHRLIQPGIVWRFTYLSIGVWFAETLYFSTLIFALGFDLNLMQGLFIMALATLSTLIPSAPGFFGTFHLAAFYGMTQLGADQVTATHYAFISHFLLWGSTTLAGLIAIACQPRLFNLMRHQPVNQSKIPSRPR